MKDRPTFLILLALAMLLPRDEAAEMRPPDSIGTRQTAATRSQPSESFRDCADCPEMFVIPRGDFVMGSDANEPGRIDREGPQRRVSIRQFALGKFGVTRGQWAVFVSATNRSTSKGCVWTGRTGGKPDPTGSWRNLGFPQDDNHPVVCVTWEDAQQYARWLTERTGQKYRLATEAEWEYAARAGSTTPYPWGSNASHEYANYGADACCSGSAAGRDQWVNTSPVGSFPANAFGLYDMHGNVLQWVQDCFASSYSGSPTDGSAYETSVPLQMTGRFAYMSGTSSCSYRMLRGGDWGNPPAMIRSAYRNFGPGPGATLQDYRSGGVGFRVARSIGSRRTLRWRRPSPSRSNEPSSSCRICRRQRSSCSRRGIPDQLELTPRHGVVGKRAHQLRARTRGHDPPRLPHVARPEGRIHFAGEHTSVWIDGWMQGALESGDRVAREVNAAI